MNSLPRVRGAVVLLSALFAFTSAASAARREGAMSGESFAKLRTLKVSERARIAKVPLNSQSLDLELERFEVWAPDAKIMSRGPAGDRELPIPAIKTFKGSVLGVADSTVFLSMGDQVSGLVTIGSRKFFISEAPNQKAAVPSIEVFEESELPADTEPFQCDLDAYGYGPLTDTSISQAIASTRTIVANNTTDTTAKYRLRLALDADFEMTTNIGSEAGVLTYMTNLIGAASTIYERDLNTILQIGTSYTYGSNTDPWTVAAGSGTLAALNEVSTFYNANRTGVSRSAVMMLSGKAFGAGIAYVGTACGNTDYGMVGGLLGTVTTNPGAAAFWDLLGFSHELGHLVGSSHTHCTAANEYGRAYVDFCSTHQSPGVTCYSGTTSLPPETGTIMSYCHLLAGYGNLRLIFGQTGEPSQKIQDVVKALVNTRTPDGNLSINGSPAANTTSLLAGTTHAASLPAGGSSYTWGITNGTINGSSTGSSVSFTTGSFGSPTVLVGTVSNARGCAVVNTRSITLTGGAPTAVADAYNATEDVTLNVAAPGVLSNDTGAPTSAQLMTQASHGTVTLNANGSFSYVPVANYNGADSFTYRAANGGGNSATVTVTLTVAAVNDPTNANNDSYQTNEDVQLIVPVGTGVLFNDSDVDGPMTLSVLSTVTHGAVSLNANGGFTYTPTANYNGPDSFTYRASQGGSFDDATVTLTVNAVNDPTTANDDSHSTNEDVQLIVPVGIGVLSNDTDVDGPMTLSVLSTVTHGAVSLNANGGFTYTPTANYNGPDSFTYRASQGGSFDDATVTLTVNAVNDPTTANDDSHSTNEDVQLIVPVGIGVLSNDTDVDGPMTLSVLSTVTHGAVSLNANGGFTYTPTVNYNGPDSFTYRASQGGSFDDATVTLTVNSVNDPTNAVNDSYQTNEDVQLIVPVGTGVLSNDTDVDGTPTVAVLTNVTHGTLSLNANGSFTYTPAGNYNGGDSFTYRASQGGSFDDATVTLTVNAVNDATNANDNSYQTNEDTPLVVAVGAGVLSNDTDIDGVMSAAVLSNVTHGTLSLNANGAFTYTPSGNYNGADSFTYRASQGGFFDDATVTLTVNSVEDSTSAGNDNYGATEDVTLNVIAPGVLTNDSDADGSLSAAIVTQAAHGTVSLSANGSFSYIPTANYTGPDSFTYQASGAGASNSIATVNLTVSNTYDGPGATDDHYSTLVSTALSVAAPGVLANDISEGSKTAALALSTANGIVLLSPDGSFEYQPNVSFTGTDTFTYTVSDGVNSDTGTVTISVVNSLPSFTSINPNSTDANSVAPVTIDGSNFGPGAVVLVNGLPVPSARTNANTMTATIPALGVAGRMHTIEVCNTDGGCFLVNNRFTTNFADVPQSSIYRPFVNTIFRNGVTTGCGNGNYCPLSPATRAQMAVFLLVAKEGSSYNPPPAAGTVFGDVPISNPFARWIEELAARGVTSGCGGGNYCPSNAVTREHMSVFLLVTEDPFTDPDPAVGLFPDVPITSPFARWIEELFNRGITQGCGGGNYCPGNLVTREQMAVFLVSTFGLQ